MDLLKSYSRTICPYITFGEFVLLEATEVKHDASLHLSFKINRSYVEALRRFVIDNVKELYLTDGKRYWRYTNLDPKNAYVFIDGKSSAKFYIPGGYLQEFDFNFKEYMEARYGLD